jgi:K+-transporting ATPase KdpF subunit
MNLFEGFMALIVLGLFIYLLIALLKPEKFG